MGHRRRWTVIPVVGLLMLALVACGRVAGPGVSPGQAGPDVTAPEVAERLMSALQDEDYDAALAVLQTGRGRDYAADANELRQRIEGAGGPIESFELDEPTIETDDDGNTTVFTGTATMTDGSTTDVTIRMVALGLQADPWRIESFELDG